jgi:hypothetical protein
MKKYLIAIASCFVFASCDKEIGSFTPANNANVPEVVLKSISQNFPNASKIAFTELEKANLWDVDFLDKNTHNETIVNKAGQILEWAVQKQNSADKPVKLSEAVAKYIEVNYPNCKIISVSEKYDLKSKELIGHSVYIIWNDKKFILDFDVRGAFLAQNDVIDKNGNTPSTDAWSKWEIKELGAMPAAIKEYLNANHKEFKLYLANAVKGPNDYLVYNVTIKIADKLFVYQFDGAGKKLSVKELYLQNKPIESDKNVSIENINEQALPKNIIAYLDKNLAGWKYVTAHKVLNSKKEIIEYYVKVIAFNTYYYLKFDTAEKLINLEKSEASSTTNKEISDSKGINKAITDHLNSKYLDWQYVKGYEIFDSKGLLLQTNISISVANVYYSLVFDKNNKLTKEEKQTISNLSNTVALEAKQISLTIQAYLTKNFANWQLAKAYKTITAEGKVASYVIEIKVGTDYYYVSFDGSETFVGAKKG